MMLWQHMRHGHASLLMELMVWCHMILVHWTKVGIVKKVDYILVPINKEAKWPKMVGQCGMR